MAAIKIEDKGKKAKGLIQTKITKTFKDIAKRGQVWSPGKEESVDPKPKPKVSPKGVKKTPRKEPLKAEVAGDT